MEDSTSKSAQFQSVQWLLENIETLVIQETQRSGSHWIEVSRLTQLFHARHRVTIQSVIKASAPGSKLKEILKNSHFFSIYSTPNPVVFYIALQREIVADFQYSASTSIRYGVKRSWKVDWSLRQIPKSKVSYASEALTRQKTIYQPELPDGIHSSDDLRFALVEIIKSLTGGNPDHFVSIAELSSQFHNHYQQPIKAVLRSICSGTKLLVLLQSTPNLQLKQVESKWQISIRLL